MSYSACVKHRARIKRISITNSNFIRYFANEFGWVIYGSSLNRIKQVIKLLI